jgi:hypothetical protein
MKCERCGGDAMDDIEAARGLPSAYSVVEVRGRFYPMRFGCWRRDAQRVPISYGRRDDAVAYCWREQAEYERLYPAPGDRPGDGRRATR